MNEFENMWDFPVSDKVHFPYANRVHPLMQKNVSLLLTCLEKDPNVRRIVLFGSSLDFRCNSTSDIDLYIEKYDKKKRLVPLPDLPCEVDLLTNLAPESSLYQEIDRTGLSLFERKEVSYV